MRISNSHVVDASLLACSDLCKDRRVSTNALEHPNYSMLGNTSYSIDEAGYECRW